MLQHSRIRILVAAHITCTVAILIMGLAGASAQLLSYVTFVVTSSQFSLLAVWLAFGPASARRIWYVALLAAFLLVFVRTFSHFAGGVNRNALWTSDVFFDLLGQVAFNRLGRFIVVCIVLTAVRKFYVRIDRVATLGASSASRIQFGLRHLMILVFVASLVVASGKQIHYSLGEVVTAINSDLLAYAVYNFDFLVVGLVYSLSIVLLGLWSALGNHRPYLPVATALLLAAVLSPVWPMLSQQPAAGFGVQAMVTVYEAMLVIGSLLVVRSSGYRLIRIETGVRQSSP